MMKRILFAAVLLTLVFANRLHAQINITPNNNATTLAQTLVGAGVTISGATYTGAATSAGTFTNGFGSMGIGSGVVLSSGVVTQIPGPNSTTAYISTDQGTAGDVNLNAIATGATQDASVLSFTVTPKGNVLTFRYVFASEEYTEYTCSEFNDIFAFLVSGPNPGGGNYNNLNIAQIPNTGLPVTINTVNSGSPSGTYPPSGCTSLSYSQYFIGNIGGPNLSFDGWITVFTATVSVIPCNNYVLKLGVADVFDGLLDSGVFLEAGSFTSNAINVTSTVDAGFTSMFEGCVNGHFTVTIPNAPATTAVIPYTVSGTATEGSDYANLTDTAYILPGQTTVTIPVTTVVDGVAEGTETLTVTVYDLCTNQPISSATLNINDPPADTAYASASAACSGATVQLTATGGGTYSWSPGTGLSSTTSATPTATITAPITYDVTITLGTCVYNHSVTIGVSSPTVTATANPSGSICQGTTVQLDAQPGGGAAGPFTYSWSPPGDVSNPNIQNPTTTPTVTTTYTVVMTDGSGCTASATVTVQVDNIGTVSLGPDVNVCPENVPYVLQVPGGPYTSYTWSTGATTPTIDVNATGDYWVTVTNGVCTLVSDTVHITMLNPGQAPLEDTAFCEGGFVNISAGPYTNVTWNTGATGSPLTVSVPGDYWFSATDVNGCSVTSDTSTVVQGDIPDMQAIPTPDTICPGGQAILDANGGPTVSYVWSTGDTTELITVNAPGIYSVTVSNGQCAISDTVTVYEYANPNANLVPDSVVCSNQPVTLSLTNGPFDNYYWSTGDTAVSTITVSTPGTYNVTVIYGGCPWPSNTVTIGNFPASAVDLSDTTICQGETVVLSTGAGFTNILWSPNGETTSSISVTTAGTYSYTATDANGCGVVSDTAVVSVNPIPTVNPFALPDTICQGSATLVSSGAVAGLSYIWNTGDTTLVIVATAAGTYSVTVSDGVCSASGSADVYEYPNPLPNVESDTTVCRGESVTFTLTNGPFLTYTWSTGDVGVTSITVSTPGTYNVTVNDGNCDWVSNSVTLGNFNTPIPTLVDTGACQGETVVLNAENGLINILWSTGDTTQTISVTTDGTFYYTATDTNGCPAISDTIDVSFQPAPTVNATASPDTICPGATSVLSANATGTNLNYLWTPTGDTTASITTSTPGVYVIRVRNDFCPVFDTIELFQFQHAPITIGNDTTVCPGESVTFAPSGGPYFTYLWSPNGETTPDITVSTPGSYSVEVFDGICTWNSDTVTLSNFVVTNPTLDDTTACDGNPVTLSAGAGLTNVTWSPNGETTTSITVTVGGTYSYTATDVNGCSVQSDTATVTFVTPPSVTATASPDTICPGGTSTLTAVGVGSNLTYSWTPTGDTTAVITVNAAGTYIVTVRDLNCPASDTVEVGEYQHAPISLGPDSTVCPGEAVTITPDGGPYVTYTWNTGATTPDLTVTVPGPYWVTVNDGNCDWVSDTFNLGNFVVVNPTLNDTGTCQGQVVVLNADGSLTNITWSPNGETTTSITVTVAGDYSYTATDANGCSVQSDTATVTFTPAPSVTATASPDTICPGGTSTLTAVGVGTNLTYLWTPGGATTPVTTVNAAGTYIIEVRDQFCPAYDTVEVFEYQHAPVTLNNDTTLCAGDSITIFPSGGPYVTYTWSNGATTPTITVSVAGAYWVTVNDGNCDWVSDTFNLSIPNATNAPLSDTGACAGNNVELSTIGGLTNIVWTPGGSTSTTITVTTAGDYSYTAVDANGCPVESDTATVTFSTPPTVAPTASPDTICPGGSSTLSANATGSNLTYSWSPVSGNTATISVTQGGTYTVVVSDAFCSATGTVTVYEFTHAPVTLGNDTTVCAGTSITLTPSGSPYVTYAWSNGLSTPTITVTVPGPYWVTVNDGNCSWVSDTFVLSNSNAQQPALNDTGACQGNSITLVAAGGLTNIIWSPSGSGSSITVTANGNYSYTATDANGCSVSSDTSTVTFTAPPTVAPTATPDTICPGGSSTLSANATGSNLTYSWSPVSGNTASINATIPGNYTVVVSDAFCSASGTITLHQYTNPPAIVSNDTAVCQGASVTVSVSGGPYTSYAWNNGPTTPTITVTTPGNYWVTVNNGNCSYRSDTFTLSVLQSIPARAHSDTTVCAGQPVVLTADQGFTTYTWNNGSVGQSITVTAEGDYWFDATGEGCPARSDTVTVTHIDLPNATITATPAAICPGGQTTLDAGSQPGVSYNWAPGNLNTPTIQVSQAGTYSVTAVINGCASFDDITITVSDTPSLNLDPVTTSCCQAVTLDPAPGQGYTFVWQDNSTGSTYTVNTTNNDTVAVSVTATNSNGCTSSISALVSIKCINATATATPDSILLGDSSTLTVFTDYVGNFTYNWSPAEGLNSTTSANPSASPAEETLYTVTVTDGGCSDTATVTVYLIQGEQFAMPNAFTPNGDGKNDGYFPVLLGDHQQVAEFRVYDRWGAQVHNGTGAWDGNFRGSAQPSGTYIYYVVVRVPDSQNPGNTKDVKLQGSFTLLR